MIIKIITHDMERNMKVDKFEFRSNQVTNWLKCYYKGIETITHDVIVFKTMEEDEFKRLEEWIKE